jgi:phospholipid/cholesterol/gamma-HCH transport system permease protein
MIFATTVIDAHHFELRGPDNGVLTLRLLGDWVAYRNATAAPAEAVVSNILDAVDPRSQTGGIARVEIDGSALTDWDSRTLVGIAAVWELAEELGVTLDLQQLPDGMRGLLNLSRAVPARGQRRQADGRSDMFTLIGQSAMQVARSLSEINLFLGQALLALWRFINGKARFLRSDVALFVQTTGPQALPIVGIINVLLGVILGFMGAVQLQQFGAEIYVADLVALGQTREIAPMMTAIVMAGRTGAAYAAQLGTMQVNEEVDALKTFGFSAMDFLVLPRMLALALMFPLLVLYADALGIFGGYLVGVGVLDLSTTEYIEQTRHAIDMGDVWLGVVKGSVFGILVAVTGCMHGMQSGRSASAVGNATTNAVVSGIIAIIVMTAIFAVLTNVLNI